MLCRHQVHTALQDMQEQQDRLREEVQTLTDTVSAVLLSNAPAGKRFAGVVTAATK